MGKATTTASGNAGLWTGTQAYVMAAVCLAIGLMGGYLIRGSGSSRSPENNIAQAAAPQASAPSMGAMGQVTPEQMKHMADAQAAPLLERLNSEPHNAQLLADLGNLYYDAQQYPAAIDYYQRSLQVQPGNTNVRTDMATAMWALGDADKAIEQLNTVLKAEPTKPNALMNLGIMQWRGKMNAPAAVAAWEKLLAANPNFEAKGKVQQLIAQAKAHSSMR